MKVEGLSTLLEELKEEIERWELEPSPTPPELVRQGLYLAAMDILYAETLRPGGYESYSTLPEAEGFVLPLEDYRPIRAQLDPFVQWLRNLMLQAGLTPNVLRRELASKRSQASSAASSPELSSLLTRDGQ